MTIAGPPYPALQTGGMRIHFLLIKIKDVANERRAEISNWPHLRTIRDIHGLNRCPASASKTA